MRTSVAPVVILGLAWIGAFGPEKCLAQDKAKAYTFRFIGPKGPFTPLRAYEDHFWWSVEYENQGEKHVSRTYKPDVSVKLAVPDRVKRLRVTVMFCTAFKDMKNDGRAHTEVTIEKIGEIPSGSEIIVHYDVNYRKPYGDLGEVFWPENARTFWMSGIEFDKTQKHVEVKESAPIRQATPAVKKEEYTVKHSVTIQGGLKAELEGKLDLGVVMGGIRVGVQASTASTVETSKTTSREVTIPGDGKAYKLIWVETFRTGRAIVYVNNKRCEIPFEFRDGWDLQTREVK